MSIVLAATWIEAESIEDITDQRLKNCIPQRYFLQIDGPEMYLPSVTVQKVMMNVQIIDA